MTAIGIEEFPDCSTRVQFDTESSRDEVIRNLGRSALFKIARRSARPDGTAAAVFYTDADYTEAILRECGTKCRMLLDILDDAAATHGWRDGESGRAWAWQQFVRSAIGRGTIEAEWPSDYANYQEWIEADSGAGIPLDKLPEDAGRPGRFYRDLSRKAAFIRAGELWLVSLPPNS